MKSMAKGRVSPTLLDKRGLTPKQVKFVAEYVKTENGTQSALKAYETTDVQTAKSIAVENLSKPSIKEAVEAALKNHGVSVDAAVKPIADGLKATREVYRDDDGVHEVVDHSVRLTASRMALRLLGADQEQGSGNTFLFAAGSNTVFKQ